MADSDNKTLILYNSVPYFLKHFNKGNVNGAWVFKDIPFLLKIIRKITQRLKFSQIYWYGDWKETLKLIDTVIIFAPLKQIEVLYFIKKINPSIRIIYWYWNPVFRIGQLSEELLDGVEVWSFDPSDCEKYLMKFNTTFYFKDIQLPDNVTDFDAVFVGNDKGRGTYLNELEQRLNSMELKTYFHVIPDNRHVPKEQARKIPYFEYLELISRSKTIIDITPDGQTGLTVRPMESIFFRKKLITSDRTIAHQDFYLKDNIFILGIDDISQLKTFVDSPYVPISNSIVDQYDMSRWLQRFNL